MVGRGMRCGVGSPGPPDPSIVKSYKFGIDRLKRVCYAAEPLRNQLPMKIQEFDLSKRLGAKRIREFAACILELGARAGFKISSRGWAYYLESERVINKNQFDRVEDAINRCRKMGLLPIDFVAEEPSRQFEVVEVPTARDGTTLEAVAARNIDDLLEGSYLFTPDWWEGEEYYIQIVVEKIDLKTLFLPVCRRFHIPIATSKGWSSMLQRAEYARRFSEAEAMGLKCVLLYCGDHDPDGLRISDFLRSNLADLAEVEWSDGWPGYDPDDLIIHRFGLNKKLIDKHKLTWIDNLITGSGKDLSKRNHPNHDMPYVQEYLRDIGPRKCEANAIIPYPVVARELVVEAIEHYLGENAEERFEAKEVARDKRYAEIIAETGLDLEKLRKAADKLRGR